MPGITEGANFVILKGSGVFDFSTPWWCQHQGRFRLRRLKIYIINKNRDPAPEASSLFIRKFFINRRIFNNLCRIYLSYKMLLYSLGAS